MANQPNIDEWLKLEFQENFEQLRNRDEKILDLLKFYITAILAVISASIGLAGLKELDNKGRYIGLLLIVCAIMGEMLFFWLLSFRKYFVTSARQINAIRDYYSKSYPEIQKEHIVQPVNKKYPPLSNKDSAHTIVLALMTYVNGVIAGYGFYLLVQNLIPSWPSLSFWASGLAFLCVAATDQRQINKLKKEKI